MLTAIASMYNTTATVQRASEGTADRYGNRPATWQTHISGLRCRIEVINASTSAEKIHPVQVTEATHYLYCAVSDITEEDRVTSGGRTYTVKFVNQQPGGTANHMEVLLREERT